MDEPGVRPFRVHSDFNVGVRPKGFSNSSTEIPHTREEDKKGLSNSSGEVT